MEALEASLNEQQPNEANAESVAPINRNSSDYYAEILQRFFVSIGDLYHLIELTDLFRQAFGSRMVTQSVATLTRDKQIVKSVGDNRVYEIDDKERRETSKAIQRSLNAQRAMAALPASHLMTMVATFEAYLSDVVKKTLLIRRDKLLSSQKTISYQEVLQAQTIEEIIDRAVQSTSR